jgi:hypothetical protein
MPDPSKAEQRLLDLLGQPRVTCNIVTAGFENDVPSNYKVTIIEIGANFTYDDGSDESYGPYPVNLGYGGTQVIMSQCTDKCCTRIFGACTAQQEGYDPVVISEFRYADPGHCLLATRFVVEIKHSVDRNVLGVQKKRGAIALGLTVR